MTMNTPGKSGRSRRGQRSQQLYEARRLPDDDYMQPAPTAGALDGTELYTPNDTFGDEAPAEAFYAPYPPTAEAGYGTDESDGYGFDGDGGYTPNEDGGAYHGAETADADDYSAYLSNEAVNDDSYTAYSQADDGVTAIPLNEADVNDDYAAYRPQSAGAALDSMAGVGDAGADAFGTGIAGTSIAGAGNTGAAEAAASLPRREALSANLSAYYRYPGAAHTPDGEGDGRYAYGALLKPNTVDDGQEEQDAYGAANVYRPREVDWAQTERRKILEPSQPKGYQVEDESETPAKRRRRRKRFVRRVVALVCVAAVLGGGAYAFREPLMDWVSDLLGKTKETSAPSAAITTPAPARGYDAAAAVAVSSQVSGVIDQISGTVEMESAIVTETSVVTRTQRADGSYDFYLFGTQDGRLLAYFEGLAADGMIPLLGGGFYMNQPPYLIDDSGSALIKIEMIEQTVGEALRLHPMMNGWAVISNASGTLNNYVNRDGEVLSRLWFAKAYPMTGSVTVAYVDTGNVLDTEERYALYIVDAEGNSTRWKNTPDMLGVVASASGAAYMNNGELYQLDKPDSPLMITDDVTVYLDCDAIVVRNPDTGKYGLFVHGEQHYAFDYDIIEPVKCDIEWSRQAYRGDNGNMTLCAVSGAQYPQPLSHYFLLVKDGVEEYVALSTSSSCPVVID